MWTDRLLNELQTCGRHVGTFVTLTYADEFLPRDGVSLSDAKKFLKDFRYAFDKRYGRSADWNKNGDWHSCSKYKYVFTSEYGDIGLRAHYHAIFTNVDAIKDYDLFRDTWHNGFVRCEYANGSTIRYVFKYISTEDTRRIYRTNDGMILNDNFHLFSKGIGKDYIYAHANEIRRDKGYTRGKYLRPLPPYWKDRLGIDCRADIDMSTEYENKLKEFRKHVDYEMKDVRFQDYELKNWYGKPKELSALAKENNGIKSFGGLKDL